MPRGTGCQSEEASAGQHVAMLQSSPQETAAFRRGLFRHVLGNRFYYTASSSAKVLGGNVHQLRLLRLTVEM